MAKVKIQGHASGTGVLTVTAPNTSTDRTITLPDSTGTLLTSDGDGSSLTGISSGPFTEINTHKFTYTSATNPMIQVIDSTNTVKAQMQGGDTSAVFGSASDHPVDFIQGAGEATRMRIATTGRVGIGDTTPSAKLEVEAGSETAFTARATVANEYGAIIQTASTNGTPIADFRQNGGSSVVKVTSDGMLVLGKQTTSTATAWNMDVSGATNIGASQNTAIKIGNVTASGMIIVNDTNMTGQLAIYLTGAGAVDIVHQTGSNWATTSSPSTTQASLYQSNGYIYLKSGRSGTMNVSVLTFRTRPQQ